MAMVVVKCERCGKEFEIELHNESVIVLCAECSGTGKTTQG